MAKGTWVNVNGTWKQVKNIWQNVGGVWKQKVIPKGNIGGVWKDFISYLWTTVTKSWSYNKDSYKNFFVDGNYIYIQNVYNVVNKIDVYGNFISSNRYYPDDTSTYLIYCDNEYGYSNNYNNGTLYYSTPGQTSGSNLMSGANIVVAVTKDKSKKCVTQGSDTDTRIQYLTVYDRYFNILCDNIFTGIAGSFPVTIVKKMKIYGNYLYLIAKNKIRIFNLQTYTFTSDWIVVSSTDIMDCVVDKNNRLNVLSYSSNVVKVYNASTGDLISSFTLNSITNGNSSSNFKIDNNSEGNLICCCQGKLIKIVLDTMEQLTYNLSSCVSILCDTNGSIFIDEGTQLSKYIES